jgi:membrane protein implicated in regulation of membrane protease activity
MFKILIGFFLGISLCCIWLTTRLFPQQTDYQEKLSACEQREMRGAVAEATHTTNGWVRK